jgi:hypothetical protein
MAKRLRNALLIMAAVAIALALILNEFVAYSAVFIGAMVVFYGLYQVFLKTKDEEIDALRHKLGEEEAVLQKTREENEELRTRKFNLAAVRKILDVGLYEIDTNFTRTWNEEIEIETGKTVQFIGALKVEIIAKYGVDLNEIRIKQVDDEIQIANLNLKSLSFKDLNYNWVIAEVLEHKKPYLGSTHRRTNPLLELQATKIKERLQQRTHEEIKQGPEELETVSSILKQQLTQTVASILGYREDKVTFVEEADVDFEPIKELPTGLKD